MGYQKFELWHYFPFIYFSNRKIARSFIIEFCVLWIRHYVSGETLHFVYLHMSNDWTFRSVGKLNNCPKIKMITTMNCKSTFEHTQSICMDAKAVMHELDTVHITILLCKFGMQIIRCHVIVFKMISHI